MNLSIHMDPPTLALLDQIVQVEKKNRSAVVKEAVRVLAAIRAPKREWSTQARALLEGRIKAPPNFAAFETHRSELIAPSDDPLGLLGAH